MPRLRNPRSEPLLQPELPRDGLVIRAGEVAKRQRLAIFRPADRGAFAGRAGASICRRNIASRCRAVALAFAPDDPRRTQHAREGGTARRSQPSARAMPRQRAHRRSRRKRWLRRSLGENQSMRLAVPVGRGARFDLQRASESCTAGSGASSITLATSLVVASISPSGASKTSSSWTCSSIIALSLALASASSMRIIARRMMSAADPCRGALIAARSLKARSDGLEGGDAAEWHHLRPKMVLT